MRLEEIAAPQRLTGLASGETATVLAVAGYGDGCIKVTFETPSGTVGQRVLTRGEEDSISESPAATRSFDAHGADFKLAAELVRIQWAAIHDPMLAVSSSRIDPLPHQLRAVYGELLPRTPLRFCLADDPGAGKTIMAGLYIKELMLRGDLARCLIIAPGGLVEQWQDELRLKFGLHFDLLTSDKVDAGYDGASAFTKYPLLIARMDQLARNDQLLEQLDRSDWDLVVVDEAHRMSAHRFGLEVKRSRRYELGERLDPIARHLLLMTATPHAGIEDSFHLFMALLDPDRFEGAFTHGLTSRDTSGLMRRMIKEDLLKFDGTPLFPERVAETVPYELSPQEVDLYDEVTDYVRTEMNRADRLGGTRKNTVGFALTVLQRRLASSPEAIYQSLTRRKQRLERRRVDLINGVTGELDPPAGLFAPDDDSDDYATAETEQLEQELVDAATAAQTVQELDVEIAVLDGLVVTARRVRGLDQDRKWVELRTILTEHGLLTAGDGRPRKLIIFTEHRDTLEYLRRKISAALGDADAIQAIHGGVRREERRRVTEEFTHNPSCRILLATDAAGEGLNLQAAHLMVNYDLPWNPNRIEQRFGRVHRIGQTEVCRLWNLVATNTREGDVFTCLLRKLEEQRQAYGGKVFDVLGQSFTQTSLRDLLIDAIRYGERPDVRDKMLQVIDASVGDGIVDLLTAEALSHDAMAPTALADLRRQMDEARARRLQPHFIESAFCAALDRVGGRWSRREVGRFEITRVPAAVTQRAPGAVSSRYERATCDPQLVERPGTTSAALIEPSHPLYRVVTEQAIGLCGDALSRGALLWGEHVETPSLLVGVELQILDGTHAVVGKRVHYVWVRDDLTVSDAGPAPYLDLDTCTHTAASDVVAGMPWLHSAEEAAMAWAVRDGGHLLGEVSRRRRAEIDKTRTLVEQRLRAEIHRLDARAMRVADDLRRGKKAAKGESAATLRARAEQLQGRLEARLERLDREAHFTLQPPRILTCALALSPELVDPADLGPRTLPRDTAESERRGVDAVLAAERRLGRTPEEQHHSNPGYDILSTDPAGRTLFIEVKARIDGAEDFIVTRTEVLYGKNTGPDHRLAMVRLSPDGPEGDEVRYLANHFARVDEGDLAMRAVVLNWADEWAKGSAPF